MEIGSPHARRTRRLAPYALALAWAALVLTVGSPEILLFTAPVFLLAAPLAFGRYVGERLIVRVREAFDDRARRRPTDSERPGERGAAEGSVIRPGLIMAHRLAERAPPAPAFG